MMEHFTPLILGCNPLDNTCISLPMGGFFEKMNLDTCLAHIQEGLAILQAAQPNLEFFSQCIAWAG